MRERLLLWYAVSISAYVFYLVSLFVIGIVSPLWNLFFEDTAQAAIYAKLYAGLAPFLLGLFYPIILKGRVTHLAIAGIGILLMACVSAGLILPMQVLPLAATFFVATGWIITNILTLRNSRNAYTLDVIRELRSNAELHKHRRNIFSKLGYTTRLTAAKVRELKTKRDKCRDWEGDAPVFESLTFIGNLYENIAYGVRRHDLDWTVVRETVKVLFVLYYEDYFEFIKYHHELNAKSYQHLIWVAEEFGATPYERLAGRLKPSKKACRLAIFWASLGKRFRPKHGL